MADVFMLNYTHLVQDLVVRGSGEYQVKKSGCSHIHNLHTFDDVDQKRDTTFYTDFTIR
jgi:hypothetical protein